MIPSPTVLVSALGFVESPRWRDGALWFSDFHSRRVLSVDLGGTVVEHGYVPGQPSGLWIQADGSVLVVSAHDGRLLRLCGGELSPVADLRSLYRGPLNDLMVDAAGRAYVSTLPDPYRPATGPEATATQPVLLVDLTSGDACCAADELAAPNGMVVIADGRVVVAETKARQLTAFDVAADGTLTNRHLFADLGDRSPDGICVDEDGHVWCGSPFTSEFVLVAEGGEVVDTIETPGRWAVACTLGGDDGRDLLCTTVATTLADYRRGRALGQIRRFRVEVGGLRTR